MSYVLIYGGLRLDLDHGALRDLGLRSGQLVPDELVAECIRAQARRVSVWHAGENVSEALIELSEWAFGHASVEPTRKAETAAIGGQDGKD